MKYIQGQNRYQATLFPLNPDQAISSCNPVRVMDAFADSLDLEPFGFRVDCDENSRPACEGFSYIMTKKYLHRAASDKGLMLTAYNLVRIMNIVGLEELKEYLRVAA